MKTQTFLPIELNQNLTYKLLQAIQAGQLNMAEFAPLYHLPDETSTQDLARLMNVEVAWLYALSEKGKYLPAFVPLTRPVKLRLLVASRTGRLSLNDFPELLQACPRLTPDLSVFTKAENDFLVALSRKLD